MLWDSEVTPISSLQLVQAWQPSPVGDPASPSHLCDEMLPPSWGPHTGYQLIKTVIIVGVGMFTHPVFRHLPPRTSTMLGADFANLPSGWCLGPTPRCSDHMTY
eukprot:Skav214629  [mRNA]  locus=scaffold1009:36319:36630:+ [translate_table: standard]